jgi:hypothetical protein
MTSFIITLLRFYRALLIPLKDRKFRSFFILILIILLSGTIFYSKIEGWPILDSIYFSITTLVTIGSKNLEPITPMGKIFTIFYILAGVGVMLGFINTIARYAKEQNPVDKFLNKREKQ